MALIESDAKPSALRWTGNRLRWMLAIPEVGVLIPLIGFAIIFYLINPVFLSIDNVTTMLRSMSYIGIIALGMTFLMITGAFDLSVGATAGLSAIVCSYAIAKLNLPISVAILAGLGNGALVGLGNGFVELGVGFPPF